MWFERARERVRQLALWCRPVGVLWQRELQDQLRDWRILAPVFGLTLLFPAIANFTAKRMVAFTEHYGAKVVAESLFPFLMLAVAFFPISISLVVALESFAGERERGSIEPLLAAPISDGQLYWGKLLAVLTLPLAALYAGVLFYVLVMGLRVGWWPSTRTWVSVLGLSTLRALAMVSSAVVISSQATSVRGANLLASAIIIPMAFLLQAEGYFMFWQHYDMLIWIALGLAVVTLILTRLGLAHFNREGLLGRELDVFNLGWMKTVLFDAFRGQARSWHEWVVGAWRQAWREQRAALGLVAALMASSVAMGYHLGTLWVPSLVRQHSDDVAQGILGILGPLTNPGGEGFPWLNGWAMLSLFAYNLRSLSLAFLGSLFTLGAVGLLLPVLTMGVVGFGMYLVPAVGLASPWQYWWQMVLPHGVAELPAILVFGTTMLRMGARWIAPAQGASLGQAWLTALGEAARVLVAVVIPLFALAAFLEAFVTPWMVMHPWMP